MAIRGIITGDIIKSGDIPTEQRGGLLDTIHQLSEELQILSPLKMELFRGDGFQIAVHKPEEALTIAVLLRAGLKSRTPEGLTEAEKAEQQALRQEYLAEIRRSFRAQLENTMIQEPDGTLHKLGRRPQNAQK